MKKRSLFVIALLFSSLTGCGGSYKVPTNEHDKVKVAFNGVEKSFKKMAAKKSLATHNELQPRYKNVDSGLSSIFGLYSNEDIRSHSIEDLSYNEPPMIQFQYLKAVFDELGNGYEFGTKYYDVITGDVFLDINTGLKDEEKKPENQYSFNYKLGIDINIDSSDLINADVSFDIDFSQGTKTYSAQWYVNLLLDYDMEQASPNYTLTMYTENDETNIPYYDRYVYEYDYVNVTDSQISEWRKFCMHSSERLVKDSEHQSFNDYLDKDNIDYVVDHPSWFKNGNYYKPTQMSEDREKTIGNILFDDLGLNANDINADPFLAKAGTKNSVIQKMYNKFSQIAKEEIIYNLVCRDEDDIKNNDNKVIAGIRAMFADGETGADGLPVLNSTRLSDLFTGTEGNDKVDLWYCAENLVLIERVGDFNSLNYQFTTHIDGYENEVYTPVGISPSETIKEAYSKLHKLNDFTVYSREIIILISDNSPQEYQGVLNLKFRDEFEFEFDKPTFPEDLSKLGVPEYDGERLEFGYSRDGENYFLKITGSNGAEKEAYLEKVQKAGFSRDWYNPLYSLYAPVFKKSFGEQENLFLQLDYNKEDFYLLKVWKEQKPNEGGGESGGEGGESGGEGGEAGGEQTGLQIETLVIVGLNGDWEIANGMPLEKSGDVFQITDITFTAGTMFKLVANGDWTIHSEDTAYGGFGFDDIEKLDDKGLECIERYNSPDGNISVKRTFTTSISTSIQGNVLRIAFKGFRY